MVCVLITMETPTETERTALQTFATVRDKDNGGPDEMTRVLVDVQWADDPIVGLTDGVRAWRGRRRFL